MSLLKIDDIKLTDFDIKADGFVSETDLPNDFVIGKGSQTVAERFGILESNKNYSFMSNGDWSCYHLVNHFLKQTGPADIYLATWSISEFSARMLTDWLNTGRIRSITALVDYRSKNRHQNAFYLAKQNFSKIKIAYCHAKVTVIRGENFYISINGSANWTENPRIESGIVSTDKFTADKHTKWISEMVAKSEYELE